jgi:Mg2+-importing ATPase
MKNNDEEIFKNYNEISKLDNENILKKYNTKEIGLSTDKSKELLRKNGKNVYIKDDKKSWLYFLLISFKDQFIIILLFLAIINFSLGDKLGSSVIVIIALISALIRFYQDYSTYLFNRKLKSRIYSSSIVIRDNKETKIKSENIVLGDIVKLNAGSIIPADLYILESKDLFINESAFTGESIPVEKRPDYIETNDLFSLSNICFMNSSVISGSASAVVINTGVNTYLGHMGQDISEKSVPTNFDKGMNNISKLLIRYMIGVCLFVLVVDGIIKGNFNEAVLFALSVAVGITPSMLPMIVNVNLTKGTKTLANKKILIKRIESIQNLGAIDILCTDKTGTLTENNIVLQKYVDVLGKDNLNTLEDAYLNSYFGTGMKNLVDRAILSYAKQNKMEQIINDYKKIDEIPFDYSRRKMSVVVETDNKYRMITKGALEEILKICSKVKLDDKDVELTNELKKDAQDEAEKLAKTGMQVIALAEKKEYKGKNIFNKTDESEMVLIGLVGFLDPPKKDVKDTLNQLYSVGVKTKILTGDNYYATQNICSLVGLNAKEILTGNDIEKLTDKELSKKIENVDVFARLNPLQKERIVGLYMKNGHVVGYMGDGVNDAPSLHQADIGISVNSATDIAKETSDMILLERSLNVIYDGIIEGRKVYGNIIKYMKMALSGDYGDVFSIMIASIFLPFLPLLPIQMLFQDFIYDFSQIGIPYDSVDQEFLKYPHKWNTGNLSDFMQAMGMVSSIFDVISFIIFWFVLGYNTIDKQAYFQTAWFVTCLITELMIIINVRTAKKPFIESNPSKQLLLLTLFSCVLTIITPILFKNISTFNFVVLPLEFYLFLVIVVLLYFITVTVIKKFYIKKYKEWL